MITKIQIGNFKKIRYAKVHLERFHVLVGSNGSGKSTFLEAFDFLRACLGAGPRAFLEARGLEFRDLTYMRRGEPIQFWVDLTLTGKRLVYYLKLESDTAVGVRVGDERLSLRDYTLVGRNPGGALFLNESTLREDDYPSWTEDPEVAETFAEVFPGFVPEPTKDSYRFKDPEKPTLGQVIPDLEKYPTANMAKDFLTEGIHYVQIDPARMRLPTPSTSPTELARDGSNIARTVGALIRESKGGKSKALREWTTHLRLAIDDLKSIQWDKRKLDNAEYLVLNFDKRGKDFACPTSLLSDGTLRMLALTLPAFLPSSPRIYMVEEPENGVHPYALEIILRALETIPESQVFVTTHSPIAVAQTGVKPLLCFSNDDHDGIRIVKGNDHPVLREWNGTPDLDTIFSSRVLG